MPSLTQKEEQSKLKQISNVYSFIYFRDYEQRDNQTLRAIFMYTWYFVQMTGLFVLCSKHNIQQDYSSSSGSQGNSSTVVFGLWMNITIYSRFNPILSYFSNDFIMPAVYLSILFILDLIFIYFYLYLAKKSTKIHENNYKFNYNKIVYVSYFTDLFRWFYMQLKTEIIFARFLCTYPTAGQTVLQTDSNQHLCSYLPSFNNLTGSQGTTLTVLCILNIVSIFICFILVFVINHSAEFTPSNPFKSKYSEIKIMEYFVIIITQYLAFFHDNTYVFIFINLKILYYLFEYFSLFPLYRADLSCSYLRILCTFIYCSLLMTIREFSNVIEESFHIEILFIGSSFIYGFVTVLFSKMKIYIYTIKLSDEPVSYPNLVCQHFYEILQLFQQTQRQDENAKLLLHGILTTHQSTCVDRYCPCQFTKQQIEREMGGEPEVAENQETKSVRSKKKRVNSENIQGVGIIQQQSLLQKNEKKQEDLIKGVYFTELMNHHEQFSKWIYEFVNYHFRYLLFKSKKERNYNIEDISMKFWFFLINDRHNIINGLYTIKSQLDEFTSKSYFLSIIDLSITRLIENNIKQKDRSLKYSFRKKDMEEAIQYDIFEQFVLSEVIKDRFKRDLIRLLDKKTNLMQSMIEGYDELDTMQNQMIDLINDTTNLENQIKSELRYSAQNLYYLKMLSIMRIRIQNDPIFATKIEKKVEEIHSKSLTQDPNLIHSITVLNGNVISIISSFKNEKGKILKYSERTPQFFGYKKTAFDSSVKSILQLMPNIISTNHDEIIERLIVEGTPKIMRTYRVAIAKDKDGFLFPIKIYINYYFQVNQDFIFSALILKLTTQSSYLLLNSSFQIEGFNKVLLEFFKQVDDEVSKEIMDKLPLQLFLPDLPEFVKQNHSQKLKMEGVKLPMIIPDRCSKYFNGYKTFLKKMVGRDYNQKKLVDTFMSQSKRYFKEDVYIFEWTMNVIQDTFKLLNGFEFTTFLVEVQAIQPVQVIQNGLKTTHKSSDQDSFAPKKNTMGTTTGVATNRNHKSPFEFDSTMFTHQYSQDQIKKKFHFKHGYSTAHDSEFSDQKTMLLSSHHQSNTQESPLGSGLQAKQSPQDRKISQRPIVQSQVSIKDDQKVLSMHDVLKKESKQEELICLQSFSQEATDQQLLGLNAKNNLRNDLLMEMTEEDLNKLRRSYDEIDFANAHGTQKQLPNQEFPARMELIINQQMCLDSSRSVIQDQIKTDSIVQDAINVKSPDTTPQSNTNRQINDSPNSYAKSKSVIKDMQERSNFSTFATAENIVRQQTLDDKSTTVNSQKPQSTQRSDKDDEQKKKAKQRMSVIQEHLNDSDMGLEINDLQSQNKLETRLNETQQNLITQQFTLENQKLDTNVTNVWNQSPILKEENRVVYDQNDTINMNFALNQQEEHEQIIHEHQQQVPYSNQVIENDQDDDGKKEYSQSKSRASNFFNSQQFLTRNSSYEKDSNPVLANLQILKESTKYSKYKDNQQVLNQQADLSDGPTVDKLDNLNRSDQSKSTYKEEVKLKPLDNQQRAVSVASSQSSQVSTTIQRIYYSASSKKLPFFMTLFFQVIGFQLIFFGSICAIVSVIFSNNYSQLKTLTLQLDFSTEILVPYSQNLLTINAFTINQAKMVNFSQPYITLSEQVQNTSLNSFESSIFDLTDQQIQYGFQNQYLQARVQNYLQSNGTQMVQDIYFFESIKTVFENLYYLHQLQQSQMNLSLDQIYTAKTNYYSIEDVITNQVTTGVTTEIQQIQSNIDTLNQDVIILSCCLLFFCFMLLIYPFWRYSLYVKGVLLSVSRMTEKEAEQEIIFCKFIGQMMKSSEEKYLSIKYTSFDLNQMQNEELGISSHFNAQIASRSKQNHQKKNYMLSQRINKPRIRLLHYAAYFTCLFIFSIAIFAIAYSIISKFNNSLNPALNTYKSYLFAVQKYGSFVYAADQIFTQRVLKINKRTDGVLSSSFLSTLKSHKMNDLNNFTSFFQSDFLYLTQKNIFSSSMNSYLDEIQQQNLCEQTSIFTSVQLSLCQSAMSSVMEQGLNVVINNIESSIGQKDIDLWSDQLVLESITSLEYENQLQVMQLIFLVLLELQRQMINDIQTLINSYTNQIVLIYTVGGVLYGLAFIIVCYSIYKNIYTRFFQIKKTVHLMPYKRLQDDQTTMNLIKNALGG